MARGIYQGLIICLLFISTFGQQFGEPFPLNNESISFALPSLSWTYDSTNRLANGSFEQGLEGWTTNGSLAVIRSSKSAHGTNYLSGRGQLRRTIELPDSPAILLSYKMQNNYPTTLLQLLSPDNEVLYQSTGQAAIARTTWPKRVHDLAAFRGRTVTMLLILENLEISPAIDDFQLHVGPPDLLYDVYLREGATTRFLGRTDSFSFPTPRLAGDRVYGWRIDAVTAASTNQSPLWTFVTQRSGLEPGSYLTFESLPTVACLGTPVTPTAFFTDNGGFFTLSFQAVTVIATAENVRPPSILITELDPGSNDSVEFVNASTEPINLENWSVQFFGHQDYSSPSFTRRLFAPAILQPGEILTMRELDTPGSWPRLRVGAQLNWGEVNSRIAAGVVIRDAQSNLIDCVFIDTAYVPGQTRTPSTTMAFTNWTSQPIRLTLGADQTYSRFGRTDLNRSSDWGVAPRSITEPNQNLSLPFDPGFGTLAVSPTSITSWRAGRATNQFTFSQPASNVVIHSVKSPGSSYPPFQLVDANHCATLTGPAKISEASGGVDFYIRFGTPPQTELVLQVTSSDPRRLLPARSEFRIDPGVSEATLQVRVPNDPFLQGNSSVTLTVQTPGYATASFQTTIIDDEKGTITLSGPARIKEGEQQPIAIKLNQAPITDLPFRVDFEPTLPFSDYTFTWRAGLNESSLYVGYEEDLIGREMPVRLTISYEDWASIPHDFIYEDNDPARLSLEPLEPAIEGRTNRFLIGLGGMPPTHTDVRLTSSNPQIAAPPETISIQAFAATLEFEIPFPENTDRTGIREVTITAAADGWEPISIVVPVLDNDPAGLSVHPAAGPWAVGVDYPIEIRAHSLDGRLIHDVDLRDANFFARQGIISLPTTRVGDFVQTTRGWSTRLRIDLANPDAFIQANLRDIIGVSDRFPIWPTIPLVQSAAYDPIRDRYLLAPTGSPLVSVHPATGEQLNFELNLPSSWHLAVTADGEFLFGVTEDLARMFRARLADRTITHFWFVRQTPETLSARSIALVPWRNDAVAVLRSNFGANRTIDLAIFIDGQEHTSIPAPYNPSSTIAFSEDRRFLYVAEPGQLRIHPLSTDLKLEPALPATLSYIWDRWLAPGDTPFGNNLFLTPHGTAFDPEVPGFFVTQPLEFRQTMTAFDPGSSRFASLLRLDDGYSILTPNPPFTLHRGVSTEYFGLDSNWSQLRPAGPNRWLLVANKFNVLNIPPSRASTADHLALTGTLQPIPGSTRALALNLTAENRGPDTLSNIVVALALPLDGIILTQPDELVSGTAPLRNGFLLDKLEPATSRRITVHLAGSNTGPFKLSAIAGTETLETDYSNNRLVLSSEINLDTPPPAPTIQATVGPEPRQITIQTTTTPGWNYQLLWQTVLPGTFLPNPEWVPGQIQRATSNTLSFIIDRTDTINYFRVRALP